MGSAESVDTLDYNPPPALPPRRPPWPSNSSLSSTASSYIGQRTTTTKTKTTSLAATAATTTTTTLTPTTLVPPFSASHGSTTSSAQLSPQPPPLTPPQYPAPPRPPSRNGGDEARVARARGSGRGALPSIILANGTPSSRVPPPRAGWAVRTSEATLTPTSNLHHRGPSPSTPRAIERWASERASSALSNRSISPSSPEASAARTAATAASTGGGTSTKIHSAGRSKGQVVVPTHFENYQQEEEELEAKKKEEHQKHHHHHHQHHYHHQQQQQLQPQQQHYRDQLQSHCQQTQQEQRRLDAVARCQAEHLELRGRPMSQKNAIPPLSRPPSSQTSSNPAGTVGFGNDVESGTDSTGSNATGTSNAEDGDAHSGQTTTTATATATAIRVHDHNRPFPPPRLPAVHVAAANSTTSTGTNSSSTLGSTGVAAPPRILLTAPLAPLSNSFRSRPSIRGPQALESSNDSNTRGLLSSSETTSPPPSRSPVGEVSLTVPRPDGERTINEYVEAPFKHCCNQERRFDGDGKRNTDCSKIERRHRQKGISGTSEAMVAPTHRVQRHARNHTFRGLNATTHGIGTGIGAGTGTGPGAGTGTGTGTRTGAGTGARTGTGMGTETGARPGIGTETRPGAGTGTGMGIGIGMGMGMGMGTGTSTASIATNTTAVNTVTKQPVSFTKEPANTLASRAYDPAGLSIMCDFCGRCRCESCREPPPLPSTWLCDNSCFCSADTILDYASCLCCVKGLFYHCVDGSTAGGMDGEAAGSCADEPCSCTGNRRVSRWACLGALTLVMPCLLCYWPFRGCVALCETCYARHAAQGCRCNPNALGNAARHHPIANDIGDSRDPEKRLLDPVTPEL